VCGLLTACVRARIRAQVFPLGTSAVWLGMQGGMDWIGQARTAAAGGPPRTNSTPSVAAAAFCGAGSGAASVAADAPAASAVSSTAVPTARRPTVVAKLGTPDKPFGCPLCDKAFTTDVNLTRHWAKEHPGQAKADRDDAAAATASPSTSATGTTTEQAVEAVAAVNLDVGSSDEATFFGNVELLNLAFVSTQAMKDGRAGHREVVGVSGGAGHEAACEASSTKPVAGFFLSAVNGLLELERMIKSTSMRHVHATH
jgi:hypothetical protein